MGEVQQIPVASRSRTLQPTLLIPIFLLAVGASLFVASQTWQHRRTPGARELTLLMLAAALWSLADAMALAADPLWLKILFSKIAHISIQTMPVFFLLFTLSFTNFSPALTARQHSLLWIIPLLTLVAIMTNDWHHLFWVDVTLIETPYSFEANYNHGVLFWISVVYSYSLILFSTVLLFRAAFANVHRYRMQAFVMVLAATIPWIANMAYIFNLLPWPWLDPTSIAFSLTGVLLAWALLRLGLLHILPVARAQLIEHMNEGMVVIDTRNILVDVNPAGAALLQIDAAAVGRPLFDVSEAGALIAHQIGRLSRSGAVVEVTMPTGVMLEVRSSALHTKSNRPLGALLLLHDVTDSKRAEKELQESERRYRTLIDHAPFPAVVTSIASGLVLYSNSSAEAIFEVQELPRDRRFAQDFYADAADRQTILQRLHTEHRIINAEVQMQTAQGRRLWVSMSAIPIEFAGEEASFSIYNDITERRAINERLRESERRYRLLAENASDVIWMLDFNLKMLYCSPSVVRLIGYSAEEIAGPNDGLSGCAQCAFSNS
jgi:PAS domain S-box-containing protein